MVSGGRPVMPPGAEMASMVRGFPAGGLAVWPPARVTSDQQMSVPLMSRVTRHLPCIKVDSYGRLKSLHWKSEFVQAGSLSVHAASNDSTGCVLKLWKSTFEDASRRSKPDRIATGGSGNPAPAGRNCGSAQTGSCH